MMCTCEVHIWSSHVIYDMHVMWFTVYDLPYMEFTCGFLWNHIQTSKSYTVNHMWFSAYDFRIWFPYMISVYGVHMLFSSMIIYGSVYDHMRKPHVEYLFACGVHMWNFPHMSPHVDLFSLVMHIWTIIYEQAYMIPYMMSHMISICVQSYWNKHVWISVYEPSRRVSTSCLPLVSVERRCPP